MDPRKRAAYAEEIQKITSKNIGKRRAFINNPRISNLIEIREKSELEEVARRLGITVTN